MSAFLLAALIVCLTVGAEAHSGSHHRHSRNHPPRRQIQVEPSGILTEYNRSPTAVERVRRRLAERRRRFQRHHLVPRCHLREAERITRSHHRRRRTHDEPSENPGNVALNDVLFQGDILLSEVQSELLLNELPAGETAAGRQRRMAISKAASRWDTLHPIAYEIGNVSSTVAAKIRRALAFWSTNTCVNFSEQSSAAHRIRFIAGTGCWSFVGKYATKSDYQDISIGKGCDSWHTLTHEIGHALGLWHAQARPDRDQFVTINYANVSPGAVNQFDKQTSLTLLTYNISYDLGSVMHYGPYEFASKPSVFTVVAKHPNYEDSISSNRWPSFADVKTVNMHLCSGTCGSHLQCSNFGYPDPRNCLRCKCPPAFTGAICEDAHPGNGFHAGKRWCGGDLKPLEDWREIVGTVGVRSSTLYDTVTDCFWVIRAPAGRRVETFVSRVPSTVCTVSCVSQGMQITVGSQETIGVTYCCGNGEPRQLQSEGALLTVRAYTFQNTASYRFWYRLVPHA